MGEILRDGRAACAVRTLRFLDGKPFSQARFGILAAPAPSLAYIQEQHTNRRQ